MAKKKPTKKEVSSFDPARFRKEEESVARMSESERAKIRASLAAEITPTVPTPSFSPARFRMAEEGYNISIPNIPFVDATSVSELAAEGEAALKEAAFYEQLATEGQEKAIVQVKLDEQETLRKAAEAALKAGQEAAAKAAAEAAAKEAADRLAADAAVKAAQEAADKAKADAIAAQEAAEKAAADAQTAAEKAAADAATAATKATQDATDAANAAAAKAAAEAKAEADKKLEAALKAQQEAEANAKAQEAAAKSLTEAFAAKQNINVATNVPTTVPGPYSTVVSSASQADILTKQYAEQQAQREKDQQMQRESIINIMSDRLSRYNLTGLIPTIKRLAQEGATEATITFALQETEDYKRRFKANEDRIKKGLQVLTPAEYLNLEDSYRQILRSYGLNQFDTDDYVSQFISNDVSAAELSNRVVTAVQRVRNADPAIAATLRDYYGIGDTDLVAYVLDPNQQFPKISTQVAAAEIGAAAGLQGLAPGVAVSEQLARQGVTQAEAQRGYATIANILPTAEKLSDIYGKTLEGYGLAEAEQEVFNSLASAQRKRQKLIERETAAFGGSSGLGRSSLSSQLGGKI